MTPSAIVTATEVELAPDHTRVITRFFVPGHEDVGRRRVRARAGAAHRAGGNHGEPGGADEAGGCVAEGVFRANGER